MKAFEDDTVLAGEIVRLIVAHHIRSVIETGTEYGGTATAFSKMVPHVVTIDVEDKVGGELPKNVHFIEGDSRTYLPFAIGSCTPPILFYLDAHTQDFEYPCPLEAELWLIANYTRKYPPPVIVIHDSWVPGHPELGYASYNGYPIGLKMVEDALKTIYPHGYGHHYNSEATGAARGVLFIEPSTPSDQTLVLAELGGEMV